MSLGLQLCGANYMDAYNFYWNIGEFYFGHASKNKGILLTAKTAFVIAADNLFVVSIGALYDINR
jgi:hypothetical protein